MRTNLMILSAVVLLAACGDDSTTSPNVKSSRANAALTSRDYPPGPGLAVPRGPGLDLPPGPGSALVASPDASAKPQSGFTSITIVKTSGTPFGGAGNGLGFPSAGLVVATCPVGSQVIAGGYDIAGGNPTDVLILGSKPNGYTAWAVDAREVGGSLSSALVVATAICIQ